MTDMRKAPMPVNPSEWPPLDLSGFMQRSRCPSCGASIRARVGGLGKNLIRGRGFPAGAFSFGQEVRKQRELWHCGRCHLIYQEWVPSKELLLKLYATAEQCHPWPLNVRRMTWARALSHLPKQGGRILDVGANDGYFVSLLPAGWDASALEPTGAMRAELEKLTAAIFKGFLDDQSLGLPECYFDAVCMFDVLEHCHDVRAALSNISRCLKPGGVVLIETGNAGCLPARLFKSLWWYYDYIEHIVFFNRSAIRTALSAANLSMESCRSVVHTRRIDYRRRDEWIVMATDLYSKLGLMRGWARGAGGDIEGKGLLHPFRVYWPDHLFVVGRKPSRLGDS